MIFDVIRQDIKKLIEADTWFSNIDVVVEDRGDVLNQVELALKKLGICIVIEHPKGAIGFQGPGLVSVALQTVFTISENVLINRGKTGTGKTATDVLEHLIVLFSPYNAAGQLFQPKNFDLVNDMGGSLVYQMTGQIDTALQHTEP